MSVPAYPLQWPEGWPRTAAAKVKKASTFKVNVGQAIDELYSELERLGAKNVVLSSNLTVNTFHKPYSKQTGIQDPGIAVYFELKEKQYVMARDLYGDWRDNIRSLGLAVEAFRALHRHGGSYMMERAFTGFAALAPPAGDKWWDVLQMAKEAGLTAAESQYKKLRAKYHPDRQGGDSEKFKTVSVAIEEAREHYK